MKRLVILFIMIPTTFNTKALLANYAIWIAFISFSLYASIIDSSRAGREVDVLVRTQGYLISFVPWMLVTPAFYLFLQRQQKKTNFSIVRNLLIMLAIWAPIGMYFETISVTLLRNINDKSMFQVFLNLPVFYWVYHLLLFGVTFGACFSLLYYQRSNANKVEAARVKQANTELELQLSELKMQSLQNQLEPHFLFNSLNAIGSLVRGAEKKQALTAIKQLSDLLRYAVEASNHQFVSFADELQFVKDYLALQSLRFGNKLKLEINDKRAELSQECPPFLLQTFVENAIKHGLEKSGNTMELVINIKTEDHCLSLFIQNTHHQIQQQPGLGIGLINLKSRLEILYANKIEMIASDNSNYYTVKIVIPAQPEV